jgi:hypothetical protein
MDFTNSQPAKKRKLSPPNLRADSGIVATFEKLSPDMRYTVLSLLLLRVSIARCGHGCIPIEG